MQSTVRLDEIIRYAVAGISRGGPPRLAQAIHYAVFPGGGRVRPKLALAVFFGLEGDNEPVAYAAAAALEMIHSASLVHDDLPCFDDALVRRGKAALHRIFGEDTAVLVGDALIVGAMQTLGLGCESEPGMLPALLAELTRASGASEGLVAGQAMESRADRPVDDIHLAKTAALFEAAAAMGAIAAGCQPEPWRLIGRKIGQAYQVADDLLDRFGTAEQARKDVGQDALNERPSAVEPDRLNDALEKLDGLILSSIESVPECPGRREIQALLRQIGDRLCPDDLRNTITKNAQAIRGQTRPIKEILAL